MQPRSVYLVGTIPLANATEVFRTVSRIVGPALRWLPDGERGERRSWLPWLEPIFSTHYGIEGTRRRIAVADAPDFAIATECGFGRRPPNTVPPLLEIDAEAAGLR
jgi:hypothetical protein